jgi:hypothetical protein
MTWWVIEDFDRDEALSASRERENYHMFSQLQRKKAAAEIGHGIPVIRLCSPRQLGRRASCDENKKRRHRLHSLESHR